MEDTEVKLITHTSITKPSEMTLEVSPLIVWLDKYIELRIEYGDTAGGVAEVLEEVWKLPREEALQLVTYWFAVGMRVKNHRLGGWRPLELKPRNSRRYGVSE